MANIFARLIAKAISNRRKRSLFVRAQAKHERIIHKAYIHLIVDRLYNKVIDILFSNTKATFDEQVKLNAALQDLQDNWDDITSDFRIGMEPLLKDALDAGKNIALRTTPGGYSVEALSAELKVALGGRMNKMKGITDTVFKEVKHQIGTGIANEETILELSNRVKGLFKETYKNRAVTVARTESSSAISHATQLTYKAKGVKLREWLVVGDSKTRPTHQTNADAGPLPIDVPFPGTGEMYPGEINCRCSLSPVIITE